MSFQSPLPTNLSVSANGASRTMFTRKVSKSRNQTSKDKTVEQTKTALFSGIINMNFFFKLGCLFVAIPHKVLSCIAVYFFSGIVL